MKYFEVIYRRTYEVKHRLEIEAKDEESARKKAEKISKHTGYDDDVMCVYPETEPDDFCVNEVGQ